MLLLLTGPVQVLVQHAYNAELPPCRGQDCYHRLQLLQQLLQRSQQPAFAGTSP